MKPIFSSKQGRNKPVLKSKESSKNSEKRSTNQKKSKSRVGPTVSVALPKSGAKVDFGVLFPQNFEIPRSETGSVKNTKQFDTLTSKKSKKSSKKLKHNCKSLTKIGKKVKSERRPSIRSRTSKKSSRDFFQHKGSIGKENNKFFGPIIQKIHKKGLFMDSDTVQKLQNELKLQKAMTVELRTQLDQKITEGDNLARLLIKSETNLKSTQKDLSTAKADTQILIEDNTRLSDKISQLEDTISQLKFQHEKILTENLESEKSQEKLKEEQQEKITSLEKQLVMATEKYVGQNTQESQTVMNLRKEYDQLLQCHKDVKAERDLLKLENNVLQNLDGRPEVGGARDGDLNIQNPSIPQVQPVGVNQNKPIRPLSYDQRNQEQEQAKPNLNYERVYPSKYTSTYTGKSTSEGLASYPIPNLPTEPKDYQNRQFTVPKYEYQNTEVNQDVGYQTQGKQEREQMEREVLARYLTPQVMNKSLS